MVDWTRKVACGWRGVGKLEADSGDRTDRLGEELTRGKCEGGESDIEQPGDEDHPHWRKIRGRMWGDLGVEVSMTDLSGTVGKQLERWAWHSGNRAGLEIHTLAASQHRCWEKRKLQLFGRQESQPQCLRESYRRECCVRDTKAQAF